MRRDSDGDEGGSDADGADGTCNDSKDMAGFGVSLRVENVRLIFSLVL